MAQTTEIAPLDLDALIDNNTINNNNNNASASDGEMTNEQMIVVCTILGFISIFGTLGNGLVLYVFTRKSDKVTSTIFILALAWTDLFTCMVIVPFTVVSIQTKRFLMYDVACKAYQFLITFNVPLSAFIMVAIAVDRYFSICHPFLHAVTPRRARISIMCLSFLAFTLGTITALMYGVYSVDTREETVARGEASWCPNITVEDIAMMSGGAQQLVSTAKPDVMPSYSNSHSVEIIVNKESYNTTTDPAYPQNNSATIVDDNTCTRNISEYVYNGGYCYMNFKYFSYATIDIFANIQASLYAISLLLVFTLYFFIYRSVVRRRAWRRKQKSWSHSPMTAMPEKQANNSGSIKQPNSPNETQQENMELLNKNKSRNGTDQSETTPDSGHGSNGGSVTSPASSNKKNQNGSNTTKKQITVENGNSNNSPPTSKVLTAAEKKTSRERRDFNFLANIRTAAMLFVVAVVFIFSFLPSWLMAAAIIPFNVIVFYMYFCYNSANPVIYAFMNQSFRKELKRVFQRGTNFLRSG